MDRVMLLLLIAVPALLSTESNGRIPLLIAYLGYRFWPLLLPYSVEIQNVSLFFHVLLSQMHYSVLDLSSFYCRHNFCDLIVATRRNCHYTEKQNNVDRHHLQTPQKASSVHSLVRSLLYFRPKVKHYDFNFFRLCGMNNSRASLEGIPIIILLTKLRGFESLEEGNPAALK